MGYRSDIKAAFYTRDTEQWAALRLFVTENFPKDFETNLEVIDNNHYSGYVFSLEDVKWYDSYPDVQAYNKFVATYEELIDDSELPWVYEFIRIGEDTEDIETVSAGDAGYMLMLRVTRRIECDF